MLTAAQLVTPVNTTLYEVAYILESVGLSPLLLATLGFLRTMYVFLFSRVEIFQILIMFSSVDQQDGRYVRLWRILGLLNTIALIISIIGGTDLTSSDSSKLSQANTYRRVSTILFFVLYLILAGIHVMCWMKSGSLMKHRRKVSCLYMLPPRFLMLWLVAPHRYLICATLPLCPSPILYPVRVLGQLVDFYHTVYGTTFQIQYSLR